MKCVGILTKCPYTAGGRSRRGSPKAGTTVHYFDIIGISCTIGISLFMVRIIKQPYWIVCLLWGWHKRKWRL